MSATSTVAKLDLKDGHEDIALRTLHASDASEEDTFSLPRPPQLAHIHHIAGTDEGSLSTQIELQEEQRYPHGLPLIILFISACSSLLLTELDNQILATAVPAITDSFGSIADVGWLVESSSLTLFMATSSGPSQL